MATIVDQAKAQMAKSVESTKENFSGIRTGRANPALLNGITVDYYGAPTPLKAVATIGVPEPRTLAVTPFDASQANAVEKALRDSDLGASPRRDGNVIRLTMPELTEERRKEYVKIAKGKAEDGKVAVRNIRRKAKESLDKAIKDGKISWSALSALTGIAGVTNDSLKSVTVTGLDEVKDHDAIYGAIEQTDDTSALNINGVSLTLTGTGNLVSYTDTKVNPKVTKLSDITFTDDNSELVTTGEGAQIGKVGNDVAKGPFTSSLAI
mgnify:CR=1 FL=1